MKFTVIGGDKRIETLCDILAKDGHEVSTFALEASERLPKQRHAASAREAAEGADCIVLPLPAANAGRLNTPLSKAEHTVEEIFAALPKDVPVCGGRLDAELRLLAGKNGLKLCDYFEREELKIVNAVATAEGAIQLLMQNTASTLWGSRCLVIGFGRIGKLLAHRLRALGCSVAVSARSFADLAWIAAYGYTPLETAQLDGRLGGFDAVVNTVPARVLDEKRLAELAPAALCMDLASRPGGVDFEAAARLGVNAVWALSLPGEVAPETSGAAIRDSIYNILKEHGDG